MTSEDLERNGFHKVRPLTEMLSEAWEHPEASLRVVIGEAGFRLWVVGDMGMDSHRVIGGVKNADDLKELVRLLS